MTAATSVTGSPASRRARAVPPVLTSSKPRATRPRPRSARPVLSETDRSARRGTGASAVRAAAVEPRAPRAGGHGDGAGDERGDGRGQEPVLDGVEAHQQRRLVVVGQDRDGLLGDDRAAVERRVDEVDGHAGHGDARREGVADGVQARERRQQRGMDVQHAAPERREHRPRRRRGDSRRGRPRPAPTAASVSARTASSPPGTRTVSIPCSAAQSSAAQARSANTSTTSAAELRPAGRGDERPQVRAAARDADRDPRAHLPAGPRSRLRVRAGRRAPAALDGPRRRPRRAAPARPRARRSARRVRAPPRRGPSRARR